MHACTGEADLLHTQLGSLAEAGDGGGAVVGLLEQRHDGLHRARDADQPAVDQRRKCLRLQPETDVEARISPHIVRDAFMQNV